LLSVSSSCITTGGPLRQPCWVIGFAQIRSFLGVEGDGGWTQQQTCIESIWQLQTVCIYLASGGFAPESRWGTSVPQTPMPHPDLRAWLCHWLVHATVVRAKTILVHTLGLCFGNSLVEIQFTYLLHGGYASKHTGRDNLPGSGADLRRWDTSDDTRPDSRCGSKQTVCQNSLAQAISSDELPENSNLSWHVFTSENIEAMSAANHNCYVAIEYWIVCQ